MAAETIKPLVVVVGPTASGKTSAAIELAEKCDGEIICADSRSIYTGMDIGTAKPTLEEQARVPHHGLDLVRPDQQFSVADFKRYADEKIKEIRARGRTPFLVGGSGLYIDAVIFDFQFGGQAEEGRRRKLEEMSLEELHKYCNENDIDLPDNGQNKRYVIRAIERKNMSLKRRTEPIDNCLVVGIATLGKELRSRIVLRSEQLFDNGVVDEAKRLGEMYGWDSEAMTGNIYPLVRRYIDGEMTYSEVKDRFTVLDWQLSKRQMTWFRRNPYIEWCGRDEVVNYLAPRLVSEY